MGYLRPVAFFNIGKKSEFYSRKYFKNPESPNTQFVAKYGRLSVCQGKVSVPCPVKKEMVV